MNSGWTPEVGRAFNRIDRDLTALERTMSDERRTVETRLDLLPHTYALRDDLQRARAEVDKTLTDIERRLAERISENRGLIDSLRKSQENELQQARSQTRGAVITASFALLTGVIVGLVLLLLERGVIAS